MSQPIEAFRNSFKIPELKQRIIFTLAMVAVYRLGSFVPIPGINAAALGELIQQGGLLYLYDMFSGGAFSNASVFALGIMPYISASIIMQLLVAVVPALERLQKEGAEGRKLITEYTRYGTIALCIIQSFGIAVGLKSMVGATDTPIVTSPGVGFYFMCVISFTTGTAFIMWLGEQISERGVGNGISLIIFISIVSRMPLAFRRLFMLIGAGELGLVRAGILLVLMVVVVGAVILVTMGQRRVPVQYPRQVKGRRVHGGQRSFLPLRVNQAGVIPIIFAQSIIMIPGWMSSAVNVQFVKTIVDDWLRVGGPLYNTLYAAMIIFFCYFYTAITFNPIEMADNLKKYGGVVVGVRPGKATAEYLNRVMTRITFVGSIFLAVVALLPTLVFSFLEVMDWVVASFFGGTSLLILVGVALDTVRQIEQHLIMHHYDGFMKGRRIRSRRG